jgi:hypothetical protein
MSAEKEPLECHRTILVARHLAAIGVAVVHIHADGSLESHESALTRLKRALNLPQEDMFHSAEEWQAEAYRLQEERIAYEVAEPADSAATWPDEGFYDRVHPENGRDVFLAPKARRRHIESPESLYRLSRG